MADSPPPAPTIPGQRVAGGNQCDGCMRGLPVDERGMHRGPMLKRQIANDSRFPWALRMPWLTHWNSDVQLCTKDRYL